ncbi:PLP-dependent aminotransferase family protein [Haloferula sp. BvORR071]|uniref:aminotransferase-like domain-containing protein n=1 Tax=Haloferula sp. BvORR071 TaxID=1396141 RepID=UPI000556437D|nr:PLP-dependent aminotransferase family protein [Haloferula sp. BvORR071]
MATALPLYQELVAKLSGLIQAGTFPPGSRFPSVRHTSREHRVSVSTVTEAYRRLEDEGLIEARPRSGYFVAPPKIGGDRFPTTGGRVSKPLRIPRGSIFEELMDRAGDPGFVPFTTAAPGDGIIPAAKLAVITREVLRKHGAAAYRYTPPQGRRELRAALSRRLFDVGLNVVPDEIITTQGGTEGLALALRATAKAGDLVAVESPSYFGTLHLIRDLGLRVIEIPVDPRTGMVVSALAGVLKKHRIAACVVQPNFQNPIGALMPDSNKRELARLAEEHDFTLIEDDVYGDLSHDGNRPQSIAAHSQRVIYCGSVSKTIAPGLRVGWLVPGRHLEEIRRLKGIQAPWNGTLSELVIAGFLDAGGYDRHLRRIRGLYAEQCSKMRAAVLAHFPDCARVNQPSGGFVLWVEMPVGFDSRAFATAALEKNIGISPGPIFSASGGLNHCFRLSCGFAFEARTLDAIATLGKLSRHFLP